jgi:hypothetical protein
VLAGLLAEVVELAAERAELARWLEHLAQRALQHRGVRRAWSDPVRGQR